MNMTINDAAYISKLELQIDEAHEQLNKLNLPSSITVEGNKRNLTINERLSILISGLRSF